MAIQIAAPVATAASIVAVEPYVDTPVATTAAFEAVDPIASTIVIVAPPAALSGEFEAIDPTVFMAQTDPSARDYLHLNTSTPIIPPTEALDYLYLNVGPPGPPPSDALDYLYLNAAMRLSPGPDGGDYLYLNTTSDTPEPVIWWLDPNFGQNGDQFMVVGKGLGAIQAEYTGIVKLNDDVCTVLVWDREPATWAVPDDVFIDDFDKELNVEYDFVVVTVPSGGGTGVVTVETNAP